MSSASKFVKEHSGGGRFFLSAAMLGENEGLTGTIAEEPYAETVSFGNEPEKEIFRIPIDLDQEVTVKGKKGSTSRSDALWSPGSNAVGFLIEQLGEGPPVTKSWVGAKGHFEQRTVGSWAPWFFVPTSAQKSLISKVPSKPASRAAAKSSSKFSCGMCTFKTDTISKLTEHIDSVHGR